VITHGNARGLIDALERSGRIDPETASEARDRIADDPSYALDVLEAAERRERLDGRRERIETRR
jgi:hypothetical protein